jgi:hypothetical protein
VPAAVTFVQARKGAQLAVAWKKSEGREEVNIILIFNFLIIHHGIDTDTPPRTRQYNTSILIARGSRMFSASKHVISKYSFRSKQAVSWKNTNPILANYRHI